MKTGKWSLGQHVYFKQHKMEEKQNQLIFTIKNTVFDNNLSEKMVDRDIVSLARKHDVAHLLGMKNQDYYRAIFRVTEITNLISKAETILQNEKIDYVLLKGAYIRKLYPEPWMRTSSDVDILIRKDQIDKAERVLCNIYEFRKTNSGLHHIQISTTDGFHIDLHFQLSENNFPLINDAWNYVEKKEGCRYELSMPFYYLFHIFHILSHIQKGGCGIRAIIDTAILIEQGIGQNVESRMMLQKAGLLRFAEEIEKISKKWFLDTKIEANNKLESLIVRGGMYGNVEQKIQIGVSQKGKIRLIVERMFMPYKFMCNRYPVLRKVPFLLPFFWLIRGFQTITRGNLSDIKNEIKCIGKTTRKEKEELEVLLKKIGV